MLDRCNISFDTPEPGKADGGERSAWESASHIPWERDLLDLFVNNQLRVVLALPLLAALIAIVCMQWTGPVPAGLWFTGILACQCGQYLLCERYRATAKERGRVIDWVGMLAASEFLMATCWSLPLFLFWNSGSVPQHLFLVSSIMAVIATRIMISANFMPVMIAGTGGLTLLVAVRCIMEMDQLYVALGAMAIGLEVFFIQVALRLQATARDMLVFKNQKEMLLAELIAARDKADAERHKAEQANSAKSGFTVTMSQYHSDRDLLMLAYDIADFSRVEGGHSRIVGEPVALGESLETALQVVRFKAEERGISLDLGIEADVPKLMADRRALHRIWLNLLSNAIKVTPDGGSIRLSAGRTTHGGVEVSVKDSGHGAEFDLAIAKGLTHLHNAEMTIASAPQQGTEVTIVFPHHRVLSGPRGEVLTAPTVATETQRKLIAVTG